MRFILWIALLLGIAWGGYWFAGSRAIEQGATAWFADSAAQGLLAENDGIDVQGFPSRFDLTITRPRISDPASGLGWSAPFAQVLAMTWKPWHVIAVLPTDQEIDLPDDRIAVTSGRMLASLRLSPSSDLSFRETVLEAHDLALKADSGWEVKLGSLVVAAATYQDDMRDLRLGADVIDLRPDPALKAALPELGEVMTRLHLDATLNLTAPLDRSLAESKPQMAGLMVRDFHLDWGGLQMSGKGSLKPGADGLAEGSIEIEIKGWHLVAQLAAELGLIRPEMAKSLNDGLAALASSDGEPQTLSLPLTMQAGWMNLGPLPLGPAPVMVQRQ